MSRRTILRPDQWLFLASLHGRNMERTRRTPFYIVLIVLFSFVLAIVALVDYIILLEVFTYLLTGGPGEESRWNAAIMALCGLVAVIAFHVLEHRFHSDK